MEDQSTEAEKKALAKAQKDAEKAAKAAMEELESLQVEEESFDVEAYLNERVPFYAILDDGKYKDDISITVNGKPFLIQRGQNVMIPRFVHNAIMDAERQKRAAVMTSNKYEEQFRADSNKQ